jgi:nitroreductase
MGAPAVPQVLVTIAALRQNIMEIQLDRLCADPQGVLQTFYLMATDMGLGGCAIGTANIDLFAKMTGIELHAEGPVGQFALSRARTER